MGLSVDGLSVEACADAKCSACDHAFCMQCRLPCHPGFSCSQARKQCRPKSSSFERLAIAEGWKACPMCQSMVEKVDESCDHMICVSCHHEFCWACLADRTVIYAHGNHFHEPTC